MEKPLEALAEAGMADFHIPPIKNGNRLVRIGEFTEEEKREIIQEQGPWDGFAEIRRFEGLPNVLDYDLLLFQRHVKELGHLTHLICDAPEAEAVSSGLGPNRLIHDGAGLVQHTLGPSLLDSWHCVPEQTRSAYSQYRQRSAPSVGIAGRRRDLVQRLPDGSVEPWDTIIAIQALAECLYQVLAQPIDLLPG